MYHIQDKHISAVWPQSSCLVLRLWACTSRTQRTLIGGTLIRQAHGADSVVFKDHQTCISSRTGFVGLPPLLSRSEQSALCWPPLQVYCCSYSTTSRLATSRSSANRCIRSAAYCWLDADGRRDLHTKYIMRGHHLSRPTQRASEARQMRPPFQ